jgi:N-acetylglucosamine kinase-like BadF-type ATPase
VSVGSRRARIYLGVDGGGSKTEFVLIDESGRVLATRREGPAYYLETGVEALRTMLASGIHATLAQGSVSPADLTYAFLGLPAYGEDSRLLAILDRAASPALSQERYRCANDMVCGWAGALGGRDGINVVAGTGSIAYGEFAGRSARAGGWGELFSDEGSAYWVAREGLNLFSRMSDGRAEPGPLHRLIRVHFELRGDLDLCAAVYGPPPLTRSGLAGLAQIVAQAARAGDAQSRKIFHLAATELAALVDVVRGKLNAPPGQVMPVSYSGGMFQFGDLILDPLRSVLESSARAYEFMAPRLSPGGGAALYAAKLAGAPLTATAIAELTRQLTTANPAVSPQ